MFQILICLLQLLSLFNLTCQSFNLFCFLFENANPGKTLKFSHLVSLREAKQFQSLDL